MGDPGEYIRQLAELKNLMDQRQFPKKNREMVQEYFDSVFNIDEFGTKIWLKSYAAGCLCGNERPLAKFHTPKQILCYQNAYAECRVRRK